MAETSAIDEVNVALLARSFATSILGRFNDHYEHYRRIAAQDGLDPFTWTAWYRLEPATRLAVGILVSVNRPVLGLDEYFATLSAAVEADVGHSAIVNTRVIVDEHIDEVTLKWEEWLPLAVSPPVDPPWQEELLAAESSG